MCQRACDHLTLRTAELCDDCIDDAYEFDTFIERHADTIDATLASEREYRDWMEGTTFSAEEWRQEQKLVASMG